MTRPGSDIRTRMGAGPPLVLDGPTGTELEREGIETDGPLWSTRAVLERPDAVEMLHRTYAASGADVVTAVTFRAQRPAFERTGRDGDAWQTALNTAVVLARRAADAADRPVWVAASQAPMGDCYDPAAVPEPGLLRKGHAEQARALAATGADLILVETMNTLREAEVAAHAAAATGLPVWVSFIVQPRRRLLSGEPVERALAAVAPFADAVLVNCASVDAVTDAVPSLRTSGRPWGAYANSSAAGPLAPATAGEISAEVYDEVVATWLDAGARIVGACCGMGPAHVRALRRRVDAG